MKHILFVCTGNTCRSPMAEALLRDMGQKEGLSLQTQSAGIMAVDGMDASEHSIQALRSRGIDYRGQSQSMQSRLLEWADLILTMTLQHKQILITRHPEILDKTFTLKEYIYEDAENNALLSKIDQVRTELAIAQQERRSDEEIHQLLEVEKRLEGNLMDRFQQIDIQDPFGGSFEDYQRCAGEIEASLKKLVMRLKQVEGKDRK